MEDTFESDSQLSSATEAVDCAIITSIEIERLAVCEVFELSMEDKVRKGTHVYWRGKLQLSNDDYYEIVISQALDMANINSALLTQAVIRDWNPSAILLVGIAGAISDDVEVGDIVVGSHVLYYERGKKTPKGKQSEPLMYPADATMISTANSISNSVEFPDRERPDGKVKQPTIHAGVIASGEKVIADDTIRNELTEIHRKILAIEMEGYGFSVAVSQTKPRCHHLIIRGISDRADSSKDQNWQPYAATVASDFAKAFLLDRPIEPICSSKSYTKEKITQIQFIVDRPIDEFDEEEFVSALQDVIGVDIRKIRIVAVQSMSTLIILEGDYTELEKLVTSIRSNAEIQLLFSEMSNTSSISYHQNNKEISFSLFRLGEKQEINGGEDKEVRGEKRRHVTDVAESVMRKSLSSVWHTHLNGLNVHSGGIIRIEPISRFPRMRSLPPPNPSGPFIFRENIINEIKRILQQSDIPANAGLVGFGGVGKTEIALHIINELNGQFPFEPFWIYCGQRSTDSILSDLEDGLGLLTQIKEDFIKRIQTIRSILIEQPRLIVFDDVRAHQLTIIDQLLPSSPPSATLITSRQQNLPISPQSIITLDVMSPEEAVQLLSTRGLAEIVLNEPESINELCRLCSNHPLALALAAYRVSKEISSGSTIDSFIRNLQSRLHELEIRPGDPSGSLRANFDISYDNISDLEQYKFRTLGVFSPQGFSTPAVMALWGDDYIISREQLERFSDASLIRKTGSNRYALHDLLNEYAQEHLTKNDEWDFVKHAHVEYFSKIVKYMRDSSAMLEQDLEAENITLAATYALHVDLKLAFSFAMWTDYYYWMTGRWQDAITFYKEMIERLEDKQEIALIQGSLGFFLWRCGSIDEAESLYRSSHALLKEQGEILEVAEIEKKLAMLLNLSGRLDEAENLFRHSLEIADRLGNQQRRADTQSSLAYLLSQRGLYDEARSLYEDSLNIFEELGELREASVVMGGLSGLLVRLRNTKLAEKYYRRSLQIKEEVGDYRGTAVIRHGLAGVLRENGEYDAAEQLYLESLRTQNELGDIHEIAVVKDSLANLYIKLNKLDIAETLILESMRSSESINNSVGIAVAKSSLAILYEKMGRFEDAEQLLRESLHEFTVLGIPYWIALVQFILAQLLINLGEVEEPTRLLRESIVQFEEIGNQDAISTINFILANLLIELQHGNEAEELLRRNIEEGLKAGDESMVAVTKLSLSKSLLNSGNVSEAEKLINDAHETFTRLKDQYWIIIAMFNRGGLLSYQGEFEQARSTIEQCINYFKERNYENELMMAYEDHSFILHQLGNGVGSDKSFLKSMDYANRLGNIGNLIQMKIKRADLLGDGGKFDEANILYMDALHAAESIRNDDEILRIKYRLGMLRFTNDNYDEAFDLLTEVLPIFRERNDALRIGNLTSAIGQILIFAGNYEEAESFVRESISSYECINDDLQAARMESQLSDVYRVLGRYEDAIDWAKRSIQGKEQIGDHLGVAREKIKVSNIYLQFGDFEKVEQIIEEVTPIVEDIGSTEDSYSIKFNAAYLLYQRGKFQDARDIFQESIGALRDLGDDDFLALALKGLADIFSSEKMYDEAEPLYRESLKLTRKRDDLREVAVVLHGLSQILTEMGNLEEAENLVREGMKINRQISDPQGVATFLLQQGLIHSKKGDYVQAKRCINDARRRAEKLGIDRLALIAREHLKILSELS